MRETETQGPTLGVDLGLAFPLAVFQFRRSLTVCCIAAKHFGKQQQTGDAQRRRSGGKAGTFSDPDD